LVGLVILGERVLKIIIGLRPGELAFVAVIVAFSGLAFWKAFEIDGFSSRSGPGVFPMVASAVMIISGIFIFIDALRKRASNRPTELSAFSYLFSSKFLAFVPMMVIFAVAMPWVGFFPAASGFIFAAISFLWHKNLILTIMVTALSSAAIYVIFRVLFQVVLPKGVLWQ
jgi:putative tricarboxylic transport membrane protein